MYNPVIDIMLFFNWLGENPWRVVLILAAYLAVVGVIAAVVKFFKWLFN